MSGKDEIIGEGGQPIDTAVTKDIFNDTVLRVLNSMEKFGDIRIPVSLGLVPGLNIVNISGFNGDIDNNNSEDIITQSPKYQYLPVAEILEISSTSINDTLLGTGLQKVLLQGLDDNWDPVQEIINMNGPTKVPTVNSYKRVNRLEATAVGALGWNEGIVNLVDSATGLLIQGQFILNAADEGLNKAFQTIYTVPAGKTAVLMQSFASITKRGGSTGVKEGSASFSIRDIATGVFIKGAFITLRSDGSSFVLRDLNYPSVISEKSDLKAEAVSFSNNARFSVNLSLLLIDNLTFGL